MTAENFFCASDGARIYYEDRGCGLPLVMVPGFLCTSAFFRGNAEVLAKEFRVITVDPRGQGYSSKTCSGNTIHRHAQDIFELMEYLQLEHVVLLGWSLAASIVVECAAKLGQSRLNGLVTVDGSLYPAGNERWNHHRAKNYDLENWFNTYLPLAYDPDAFYEKFIARISCVNGMDDEMKQFIRHECEKTMPWSALELHYDFIHTDNFHCLQKIKVPFASFGARSAAYGLDMVAAYAAAVSGYSETVEFTESGHLMFYYEAEKFNDALAKFIRKAASLNS